MLKSTNEVKDILDHIEKIFPNASCELIYHNVFELSVATILSAQTTDKAVNKVTPVLFAKYPNPYLLSLANDDDVRSIIKQIGLANTKAKHIIEFSKIVVNEYDGIVPASFERLTAIPGVGRKTANVILTEGFRIPRLPVDTHVERVSKRLSIVDENATTLNVEETLMELIPDARWHQAHHLLLFFGRYFCTAKKPNCNECFNKNKCQYQNTH